MPKAVLTYYPASRGRLMDTGPKAVEAVCVCRGYADFLGIALPLNLPMLDRMVVVTDPKDRETAAICAAHRPKCLLVRTSQFGKGGGPFNKGAALNAGFAAIRGDGWVLCMDADIVLTEGFREHVLEAPLHQGVLYGARRAILPKYEDWVRWSAPGSVHPADARPAQGAVLGYFQLFHALAGPVRGTRGRKWYPEGSLTAARSDLEFAGKWGRSTILPLRVAHLGRTGANWRGRKTPPFTGVPNRFGNKR